MRGINNRGSEKENPMEDERLCKWLDDKVVFIIIMGLFVFSVFWHGVLSLQAIRTHMSVHPEYRLLRESVREDMKKARNGLLNAIDYIEREKKCGVVNATGHVHCDIYVNTMRFKEGLWTSSE